MTASFATVVDPVRAHYEASLRAHGATARGMDWKDEASQRLRFDVLCDVCPLGGRTLHEVGAGVGHLYDHLRERGVDAEYSGSDVSPAMVAAARARLPDVAFERRSVLDPAPAGAWDVVVASGVFHVKLDADDAAWARFVHAGLERMWDACRVAIAFNLMTDQVDHRVPALYYSSPAAMLDHCRRRLGRHVVVRHDYPLFEYTVYVYRGPRGG